MVYSSACTFSFCFCTFCYYFCIFCFSTLGLFHTEGGCRENWRQGTPAAPPVAAYSPYSRVLSTTEYLFVLNLVSITLSNMCEHHSGVEKITRCTFNTFFQKEKLQLQCASSLRSPQCTFQHHLSTSSHFPSWILTNIFFELMNGHSPLDQDTSSNMIS